MLTVKRDKKQIVLVITGICCCLLFTACGIPRETYDGITSETEQLRQQIEAVSKEIEAARSDMRGISEQIETCEMEYLTATDNISVLNEEIAGIMSEMERKQEQLNVTLNSIGDEQALYEELLLQVPVPEYTDFTDDTTGVEMQYPGTWTYTVSSEGELTTYIFSDPDSDTRIIIETHPETELDSESYYADYLDDLSDLHKNNFILLGENDLSGIFDVSFGGVYTLKEDNTFNNAYIYEVYVSDNRAYVMTIICDWEDLPDMGFLLYEILDPFWIVAIGA